MLMILATKILFNVNQCQFEYSLKFKSNYIELYWNEIDVKKLPAQKCKLPIAFNKRRNLVAFWIMGRKSWQGTNRGIACSRRWKYLWSKQMNAINLNSVYQSFFIAVKCFLRNHCFWHLFVPREVFNGCSHYFSFVAKPVFHWDNNLTLSF